MQTGILSTGFSERDISAFESRADAWGYPKSSNCGVTLLTMPGPKERDYKRVNGRWLLGTYQTGGFTLEPNAIPLLEDQTIEEIEVAAQDRANSWGYAPDSDCGVTLNIRGKDREYRRLSGVWFPVPQRQ